MGQKTLNLTSSGLESYSTNNALDGSRFFEFEDDQVVHDASIMDMDMDFTMEKVSSTSTYDENRAGKDRRFK